MSVTIVAAGAWDAASAGNLLAYAGIGADSNKRGVAVTDTVANDVLLSRGHGLSNGNRVFLGTAPGESGLPTGLANSALYFVVGATADSFQLSLTQGGAPVDITALGEVAFYGTTPEVISASGGNIVIAAGAFDVDLNGL